jgi:hypothetical protein
MDHHIKRAVQSQIRIEVPALPEKGYVQEQFRANRKISESTEDSKLQIKTLSNQKTPCNTARYSCKKSLELTKKLKLSVRTELSSI